MIYRKSHQRKSRPYLPSPLRGEDDASSFTDAVEDPSQPAAPSTSAGNCSVPSAPTRRGLVLGRAEGAAFPSDLVGDHQIEGRFSDELAARILDRDRRSRRRSRPARGGRDPSPAARERARSTSEGFAPARGSHLGLGLLLLVRQRLAAVESRATRRGRDDGRAAGQGGQCRVAQLLRRSRCERARPPPAPAASTGPEMSTTSAPRLAAASARA